MAHIAAVSGPDHSQFRTDSGPDLSQFRTDSGPELGFRNGSKQAVSCGISLFCMGTSSSSFGLIFLDMFLKL